MTDSSPVVAALSKRARIALGQTVPIDAPTTGSPEAGLLHSLRFHLLGGETHYPARPGMQELRGRIDARIATLGCPERGAGSVLITASEGESLFVTLLGLGVFPDGAMIGARGGAHQALLDWMEIPIGGAPPPDKSGTVVHYREASRDGSPLLDGSDEFDAAAPNVVVIGDALFSDPPPPLDPRDIIVGSFRALDGMSSFSLGFVAAEPEIVKRVTTWKQASSICAPSPPQRAALWALGARP